MGGEVKTNVSNDFKAMEAEMNLRHEGMLFFSFPFFSSDNRKRKNQAIRSLIVNRNGSHAQVNDYVYQSHVEAQRGR